MAITDKFKKGESLFSTTLSSGISTGTGETITLASVTGLPTDTEITLTFDRVDANGDETPSLMERITGTIVGSALTSYTRGTDGSTEQAHSASAVIEYIFNSQDLNDMVDGIVVEHGQDGTHDATKIAELAGSQTFTGIKTFTTGLLIAPDVTSGAGVSTLPTTTDTLVAKATTDTLTNKRVTKRVTTIVSNATPTVNTDNCDVVTITALAAAITSMTTNLSGTPTNFQTLIFRILDDATARAITWGAKFEARGVDLPTTTTISKLLTAGFIYDTVDDIWGCVAVSEEA